MEAVGGSVDDDECRVLRVFPVVIKSVLEVNSPVMSSRVFLAMEELGVFCVVYQQFENGERRCCAYR